MQRSKQQALMFLLGAVLVGGALGFTADQMWTQKKSNKSWAPRQRMYDDLALTDSQRVAFDALLDEQNCQISSVMKPVRPRLDSIRGIARQQMSALLTPEQQAKLEARRAEMARRDSVERVRRDSIAATRKSAVTCKN